MTDFKTIFSYLFLACGAVLMLITLGSLVFDNSYWFLTILIFPRVQVLIALVICLVGYVLAQSGWTKGAWLFTSGLIGAIGIQAYIVFPYTPLARFTIAPATPETGAVFSLLLANVLMENRRADELLKIIADKDPTFILAMEVNKRWIAQLSELHAHYPYRMTFPADNTYGMALYSKLPLTSRKILFLNHGNVPSFLVHTTLPGGATLQLLTVHPVAPVPSEHPDNEHQKEVGLIKAARLVEREPTMPTLVAGDFNDVGWSYNMKQFEAISHLNDVRRGRGLFSTFDATSLIMRWPLDYVYASSEFRVLDVERLPSFGSDHFPFYVRLALQP